MMRRATRWCRWTACAVLPVLLGACAARVGLPLQEQPLRVHAQHLAIALGNGGELTPPPALEVDDLWVSVQTVSAWSTQRGTFSPVIHAELYLGDRPAGEAISSRVRTQPMGDFLSEAHTVSSHGPQKLGTLQTVRLREWAQARVGTHDDTTDALLQAPGLLNPRMCELNAAPAPVHLGCISGLRMLPLTVSRNDRFGYSRSVLDAFNQACSPVTAANPHGLSPSDLRHMRDGAVPSIRAHQPLRAVGHLKSPPMVVAADQLLS